MGGNQQIVDTGLKRLFLRLLLVGVLIHPSVWAQDQEDFNLYQVDIVGENYLVNMNGNTRKLGFVTSKYVEAQSLAEAERLAVRLVKLHLRGKVLNMDKDPPEMKVVESLRIENLSGGPQESALGLVWYPMSS